MKELTWEQMLQILYYKELRKYPNLDHKIGRLPKSKPKVTVFKWRKKK